MKDAKYYFFNRYKHILQDVIFITDLLDRERDESSDSDEEEKTAPPDGGKEKDKSAPPTVAMDIITEEEEEEEDNDDRDNTSIQKQGNFAQGSNRLEMYMNLESFREKSLKIMQMP